MGQLTRNQRTDSSSEVSEDFFIICPQKKDAKIYWIRFDKLALAH